MILLDPDLEPDPAPTTKPVKRDGALAQTRNSKRNERDFRLPSVRGLARFLADAQAAVRLKGRVTVLLTTDAAIARLNGEFRGKRKATDVLSFPAGGVGAAGMAGDLAVSVETARRQAAEQGHSLAVEIKVLMLHGLLHLAGFDHEVDDGRMARREKGLRARLGLPLGLIERAGGSARETRKKHASGAKARVSLGPSMSGLKPGPTNRPNSPSGAKARVRAGGVNVRAEARTLRMTSDYAGAKARSFLGPGSARLKSCPVTRPNAEARLGAHSRHVDGRRPSGAKAHGFSESVSARLKSFPFKAGSKAGRV